MRRLYTFVASLILTLGALTAKATTIEFTAPECEWYDYLNYDSHYWQFWGYDADRKFQFSFYKYGGRMVDGQEVATGTYDMDELDGKYVCYADKEADTYGTKVEFVSGTITVTSDQFGATGEFAGRGDDGKDYVIHIEAPASTTTG